jgi:hypothetical protein
MLTSGPSFKKKKKKQYQITRTDPIGFSKNKKRKEKG